MIRIGTLFWKHHTRPRFGSVIKEMEERRFTLLSDGIKLVVVKLESQAGTRKKQFDFAFPRFHLAGPKVLLN